MAGEATVAPGAATAGDDTPAKGPGVLRQVWEILSLEERRRFLLLQPLVVFTALLETAGLASIVPFLSLLSDPDAVDSNSALGTAYELGGFASTTSFFLAVGGMVLTLITVGNVVNVVTTWALLRFAWMGNHSLSHRLLWNYLEQPYSFFLQKNSAELANNIFSEVNQVVVGILVALTQMIARGVIVSGVVMTLLFVDPLIALGAGGVFGALYGAVFLSVRQQLKRDGELRHRSNGQRHKIAQEAFGSIKELKLYGMEAEAARAYAKPSLEFGVAQARAAVVGLLPRYAIETIAFGGVLVVILGLLWRGQGLTDVLPVLGLYAFAAYRILPGLQAIFNGLAGIRFAQTALDTVHRDLHQGGALQVDATSAEDTAFKKALALDNVSYNYANMSRPALNGVSLLISPGEWVAFVGPTGAGKSTLVDILLGLLTPQVGEVVVDGAPITEVTRRSWQRQTAYVPQQIFLLDDSIARNICFGADPKAIDVERMKAAARIAQIHDFIELELPNGYETAIGERGVRLSGGQRQRIGIARALYRRPAFLVLDEATSALDNATEARFFSDLRTSLAEVCVVSIAHRLSTTRGFDRIYVLEQGQIADSGTHEEISQRSPHFRLGLANERVDHA